MRQDAWELCVPHSLRQEVIIEHHDDATSGHLGVTKTIAKIARSYYWSRMQQDIKRYVLGCDSCQQFKTPQQKPAGKMGTINATRSWEIVAMNIIGPVTKSSKRFSYLLVIQDKFTKWIELQPLRQATTGPIVEAFKSKVVLRFGKPRIVITDNGTQFTSNLFTNALQSFGTQHIRTSPYSP